MRVKSYLEMLTEYGIYQLDPPDEANRTDENKQNHNHYFVALLEKEHF